MKRTSFLLVAGILITVLSLGYLGYQIFQKGALANESETLDKEIAVLNNKILEYENNKIMEAVNAKKLVQELEASTIIWSRIIQDIKTVVPVTKDGVPLVDVLSYSGASDNRISLSMKTSADSEQPYIDAADLIKAFNDSTRFVDAFVPALSSGVDMAGNEVLSFMLTTKYVKSDVSSPSSSVAPASSSVEKTDDASAKKITR